MEGNPCETFFREHADDKDKVKKLIACGQGDEWAAARLTASIHSPKPLSDRELVVRQLHSPVHWDSGVLKPGFYADLSNKGLSLNRLDVGDAEALDQSSETRASSKQGRTALGFLVCTVGEIERLLRGAPEYSGGLFDTALEHDASHADACQTQGVDKAAARAMKEALYQGLKESFFTGTLQDYLKSSAKSADADE